jgi:hypothetical protein
MAVRDVSFLPFCVVLLQRFFGSVMTVDASVENVSSFSLGSRERQSQNYILKTHTVLHQPATGQSTAAPAKRPAAFRVNAAAS